MEEWTACEDPRPVRLTVNDFLLLADAGALDAYGRTELIEGVIVETSPMSSRHAILTSRILVELELALRALGWSLAAIATPTVKLFPHNAPEPDVIVARLGDDRYFSGEAAVLAVEISLATLQQDLTTKRDLYARGGIPEYWVVDAEGHVVHQFWSPQDGVFTKGRVLPLAGELRSATMPDLAIGGSVL